MSAGLQAAVAVLVFLHLSTCGVRAQLSFNPYKLRKAQQQTSIPGLKAQKSPAAPASGQLTPSRFGQPVKAGFGSHSKAEPPKASSGGFLQQLGAQKRGSAPSSHGIWPGATLVKHSEGPSVVSLQQQDEAHHEDFEDYEEVEPEQVSPELAGHMLQQLQLQLQAADSLSSADDDDIGSWVNLQGSNSLQSMDLSETNESLEGSNGLQVLAELQSPALSSSDAAHKALPSTAADSKEQQRPDHKAAVPIVAVQLSHTHNTSMDAVGPGASVGPSSYGYGSTHGSQDSYYGYGYDNDGYYGSDDSYGGSHGGDDNYGGYGGDSSYGQYDGYDTYGDEESSPHSHGTHGQGGYGPYGGHYGDNHCGVCCPDTNTTRQEVQRIITPLVPYTATATCPKTNFSSSEYGNKCEHDNTANYQYGGSCRLVCSNPVDYLLVTPMESGWTGGCSDLEDAQTTCTFIAVNSPDTTNEATYSGSCTITARAKCCKQLCKDKHSEVHYNSPKPQYGGDDYYTKDDYGHGNQDTNHHTSKKTYDTYNRAQGGSRHEKRGHSEDTHGGGHDSYEQPSKRRSSYKNKDKSYHEVHDGSDSYDKPGEIYSYYDEESSGSGGERHDDYTDAQHRHSNKGYSDEGYPRHDSQHQPRKGRSSASHLKTGATFNVEEYKDRRPMGLHGTANKELKKDTVGEKVIEVFASHGKQENVESHWTGTNTGANVGTTSRQPAKAAPASDTPASPIHSAELIAADAAGPSNHPIKPLSSPPPPRKWVQPRKAYMAPAAM